LDSTRLKDVILEYYFYHGFGLKDLKDVILE
jgi:hypothetical protein